MGNATNLASVDVDIASNSNRDVFVELLSITKLFDSFFGSYVLFTFQIRFVLLAQNEFQF